MTNTSEWHGEKTNPVTMVGLQKIRSGGGRPPAWVYIYETEHGRRHILVEAILARWDIRI